ncbi:hypothetical protein [Sediminibacterium sp.]|uniref:hypothetical protein n=1 Tax=Sediminibacterium sp. TaxID=1917865 RepID=UPI0025EF786A|nr:hypothetical protein [Sediminibacterium sp.]MBT9483337.1 hypothetical protein [Sediminibacterium sp.]
MTDEENYKYLDEERKKIWQKINSLEEKLKKSIYDIDTDLLQTHEEVAKIKSEATILIDEIRKLNKESVQHDEKLKEIYTEAELSLNEVASKNLECKNNLEACVTKLEEIKIQSDQIQTSITGINNILDKKNEIETEFENITLKLNSINETATKINQLFKIASDRKREIDEVYIRIIGETTKDDLGNEVKIEGLRDELNVTYNELEKKSKELKEFIETTSVESSNKYNNLIETTEENLNIRLTNWEQEYSSIKKKIEDLLPNALTTGLSFAYSEKKKAEQTELNDFNNTFLIAIGGLILISLIPFAISAISIYNDVSIDKIISRTPKIILAILPVYIPILWVAYSSNRKMNLAKRLIEEYSHKEVLSKTFEGLSNQIENIEQTNISNELRVKLLYNIIEVNSENPGKLISDYNKTDHPLADAMDKSIKLTNAVTKLAKVPGFAKIAKIYADKAESIIEKENKKAENGLVLNEALND